MNIVIIGPGALGTLLAAMLAGTPGNNVRLLDRDPQRAARLADRGLLLQEGDQSRLVRLSVTADPQTIPPAELVLLCVKSRDTAASLYSAKPFLSGHSLVIPFQNGIGHLDACGQALAGIPWAIGVTALGATLVEPGHVRHGGQGLTRVGFSNPPDQTSLTRLGKVTELLNRAGIPTEMADDIMNHVWAKLLINVGINALTAIADRPNGYLLESAAQRRHLTAAIREAEAVARALGITLTADPVASALATCKATADNISSMLQDIRRGKPTEIDAINGAVLDHGRRLHIPCPTNQALVSAIKRLEIGEKPEFT